LFGTLVLLLKTKGFVLVRKSALVIRQNCIAIFHHIYAENLFLDQRRAVVMRRPSIVVNRHEQKSSSKLKVDFD
jgi:hypothetical protein